MRVVHIREYKIMIELIFDGKQVFSKDPESVDKLEKNYFGRPKKGMVFLDPEEALYVLMFQNGRCRDPKGKELGFNAIAPYFARKENRLMIRYNAYRDWRDRGLVLKRFEKPKKTRKSRSTHKKYPSVPMAKEKLGAQAFWYPKSLSSVMEQKTIGKELFDRFWFGQYGIYKQDRGNLLKLDFLETVFLSKHMGVEIISSETGKPIKPGEILKHVIKEREYARQLYDVYEDWRLRGYVVKTGFKFGSHFRIYFPDASPKKTKDKWIHSRHVIHVFPKDEKLLISEWARAVRVAHGVKKTFLLSIPEMEEKDYTDYPADYTAYRRKKVGGNWIRETPEDKPRYLLVTVSEDEHIGGIELASLLKKARELGLELLLSIVDRETAITYYVLKQIILPGSGQEYYEIEWMKP